ncbi:uncharacterized protein (TIGR03089 family) [Mumia flava]|uniref:Uncharacterized protein (TIGR03089 family) n=1 Tax=Mumia flava TaxID=1348852 RepID=A0A0B2BMN3_9ACTN|nr:TIGR03089 family protein [Mumia flava]PJJ58526.1 uncharacterized protein (TIGR03089 family) [Mumia flava]
MTIPVLLARALATQPERPFVTFYDLDSGERIELSLTTTANWVAKTANLLQDTLGSDDSTVVRIDLPLHWQTAVWVLATWTAGATVTLDGDADVHVVGPDGLDAAGGADEVVALSLRPMAARFVTPLPPGVMDYNAEVGAHGDRFTPYYPPAGYARAVRRDDGDRSHAELTASAEGAFDSGERLLIVGEDAAPLLEALPAALAADGSLVLVRCVDAEPDPERIEALRTTERVTRTL